MSGTDPNAPVTLASLKRLVRAGEKFAMLACYDATTARWLERGGVPVLLVGDSAAQMILGEKSTTHAPLDFMITITAAVKRGAPRCFVMGDMPFLSYQADDAEAVRNAGRFVIEGNADAVKLEVDASFAPLIEKIARAGIAVVPHIGWRPQRTGQTGVPLIAGKTEKAAQRLVELAVMMENAGATMLLIEQCTAEAAARVVDAVKIPVIGCGAGPACHGQVVIVNDLLGLTDWQPSFITPDAQVGQTILDAGRRWVERVGSGAFPGDHPYQMTDPS